jgi:hypothetical protein
VNTLDDGLDFNGVDAPNVVQTPGPVPARE